MFKRDSDYKNNLSKLKKVDYRPRSDFIEKGGQGKMPGGAVLGTDTGKACAALLLPSLKCSVELN